MILKMNPLPRDLTQLGKGKNLKSPAVREDGTIPPHKRVEPPEITDYLLSRTHMKMVGIAQDNAGSE